MIFLASISNPSKGCLSAYKGNLNSVGGDYLLCLRQASKGKVDLAESLPIVFCQKQHRSEKIIDLMNGVISRVNNTVVPQG